VFMAERDQAAPDGGSAYTQSDADELVAQHDAQEAAKRRNAAIPECTCKGSPFGMDVDRCPVHGEGCA
jgi:zona occludens toxin (predicted ATPase)